MIKGLQKTTLIDYPGKIACVVFFAGCNFRCSYCYNANLVFNSKDLAEIKQEEVLDFLKKKKKWVDGVVIGGGEPTLSKELPEFLKKIKESGFLVKLDTNGSNPSILSSSMEAKLIDYVAMDIKAPLDKKGYKRSTTFGDIDKIKKSIKLLMNSGLDYEFRTTVVPSTHKESDIIEIAKQIKGAKKYVLQRFLPEGDLIDKKLKNIKPFSEKDLIEMQKKCNRFVPTEVRA